MTTFFHYEEGTSESGGILNDQDADSVAYQAPTGALVFSSGTLGYPWAVDPDASWNQTWPLVPIAEGMADPAKPEVLEPDPRLQQFTANVLDDLRKPNPPSRGGGPPGHAGGPPGRGDDPPGRGRGR